jgi:prepilin-type N-terminal cleavage/methylation domain-containing protein
MTPFKQHGFTLIELLIYMGILAVTVGIISGIVYTVSRSGERTTIEEELNNTMMRLEEVFRQKIENAKTIQTLSGSLLILEMRDTSKNPTQFSLENGILYLKEGTGANMALNDPTKVKITSLLFSPTGGANTSISPVDRYAWNDLVGWVDFAYPGGNVYVPWGAGELRGLAYILSNNSWISLNCLNTNSCNDVSYQVEVDEAGELSGWAWSENFGWLSFNCETDGSCAYSNYKVTLATSTGEFDGYAWSENMGWLSFNCKTGGPNQTDICDQSDYRVRDLRLQSSAVKIDITLQYNSNQPQSAISRSNTFVFNILSPYRVTTTSTTTTEPTTKYSCNTETYECYEDSNGPYNGLEGCEISCQKYKCNFESGQCVADENGSYNTLEDCLASCTVEEPVAYLCDPNIGSQCIACYGGQDCICSGPLSCYSYTDLESCQGACRPFSCNTQTGMCYEDPAGNYNSLGHCSEYCERQPTKYKCDELNWQCYLDFEGIYNSLDECTAICQPIRYKCDTINWECYQDPMGIFNSFNECFNNCRPF